MPVAPMVAAGNGIYFMVGAGLTYEIVAAACSSPQTAEINADKRATTLMKWVNIGMGQTAIFVVAAVIIDRTHIRPTIAGAGLAAALMYGSYLYAKKSGLENPGAGTEGQGA